MPEIETSRAQKLPKGTIRPLEGTKAKKPSVAGQRVNWTPEHIKTMVDAFPALLTEPDNRKRFDLAMEAQLLLPKEYQRTYSALYWIAVRDSDSLKRMLGLLPPLERKLSPETLAKMQAGKKAHLEAKKQDAPAGTADSVREQIAKLEREKQALETQAKEAKEIEAPVNESSQAPQETKPARRNIKWNPTMFAFLAHDPKVKALIENKGYAPPNAALVEAVMKAQHKHFQRTAWRSRVSVMQSCHHKPGLLNQLRMGLAMDNPHPPKVEDAPQPQEAPAQAAQSAAAPQVAPGPQNALATALAGFIMGLGPAIEQLLTNAIRAGMAGAAEGIDARIKASVRETVIDILGSPTTPEPAAPITPEAQEVSQAEPRRQKTRVDIVGLLGDQEQVVRAKYGDLFDLRFIGAKQVEHSKITAPVAIMCRKFVSHSAQDRIKKAGANLVYANGGADSVSQHLASMVA